MQTSAAEALAEIGKPAFPKLAQAAHDPDTRTRRGALTALAEFGPKGEEYLNEALSDGNPDIRAHAKKVLDILKHEGEIPAVRKAGMAGIPGKSTAQGVAPSKKLTDVRPEKIIADPDVFIAQFVSPDRTTRMRAIECLAAMGEPAFRPLVFVAHHPDKSMRTGALQALSHLGTMGAPYIVKALEDEDLEVQHCAYQILNHLEGKFGLPRVGGARQNVYSPGPPEDQSPPRTTREPHATISELYPTDIIPRLTDSNSHVRKRAIRVLSDMGEPAFLPLVYAAYNPDRNMRIGALQALVEFGTMGAPYIVKALEDADLEVQHTAYQILKERDRLPGLPRVGSRALPTGTSLAGEMTDEALRTAEAERVNPDLVQDPDMLVELLDHPDKNVQVKAAIALAMLGSAVVPSLINAFTGGTRDKQATASEITSSFGPDAIEPLVNALRDPRSEIVTGTASVLGKLGDRRAVLGLISILDRQDHVTGIAAAEALGYLGDRESVEALINALNGNDSALQSVAARALGYIGEERAVSSLIEALGSEDFSLRRIAIDALTGIGRPSIPYLSEALRHREQGVRSGAAECFRQMGHIPETERDQIYLLVANEEWLELTKWGEKAVEVLDSFVDDGNEEIRGGTVTALGKIGGPRAIGCLTRILADNNTHIRRKAMGSLAEMGVTTMVALLQKLRDTPGSTVQQQAIDLVLERIARKNLSRQGP